MRRRAFTLIELIMIIVILGILAVVAVPKYFDLQKAAREAAVDSVVGGVRSGLQISYANSKAWPDSLEATTDVTGTVFEGVLQEGVPAVAAGKVGWFGAGDVYTYTFSSETNDDEQYTYKSTDGSFKNTTPTGHHVR